MSLEKYSETFGVQPAELARAAIQRADAKSIKSGKNT
jgi:hypothetical protein